MGDIAAESGFSYHPFVARFVRAGQGCPRRRWAFGKMPGRADAKSPTHVFLLPRCVACARVMVGEPRFRGGFWGFSREGGGAEAAEAFLVELGLSTSAAVVLARTREGWGERFLHIVWVCCGHVSCGLRAWEHPAYSRSWEDAIRGFNNETNAASTESWYVAGPGTASAKERQGEQPRWLVLRREVSRPPF